MKFRKRAKGESFKLFKPPVNEDVADTRDVYKKLMKDRINQGLWTVLTGAGLEQQQKILVEGKSDLMSIASKPLEDINLVMKGMFTYGWDVLSD